MLYCDPHLINFCQWKNAVWDRCRIVSYEWMDWIKMDGNLWVSGEVKYFQGKSRGGKGCMTQNILTVGSVRPFSLRKGMPNLCSDSASEPNQGIGWTQVNLHWDEVVIWESIWGGEHCAAPSSCNWNRLQQNKNNSSRLQTFICTLEEKSPSENFTTMFKGQACNM